MKIFTNIDNKVVLITESQAMDLLFEAASIEDIHTKYYSDIPQDTFVQIIETDPTYKPNKMGKYGKWLLSLYKSGGLKLEDLYKAAEYLSTFNKFINKIEQKDINTYKSLPQLYNVVKPFIERPEQATSHSEEIRNIKKNAERFYEDNRWLVIIPNTEEAACYYGKGTEWCTAATRSDNMFNSYNTQGKLYINIDKQNNRKYQFHFEGEQFMDELNEPIREPIMETIGLPAQLVEKYKRLYGSKALPLFYDTTSLLKVYGANGYFVISNKLVFFDTQYNCFATKYRPDPQYTIDPEALLNRYIPLGCHGRYCNIYDLEENQLLFGKNECPPFTIMKDEFLLMQDTHETRIYSLETRRYTYETPGILQPIRLRGNSDYNYDVSLFSFGHRVFPLSLKTGQCLSGDTPYTDNIEQFAIKCRLKDNSQIRCLLTKLHKFNNAGCDIWLFDGTVVSKEEFDANPTAVISQHQGNDLKDLGFAEVIENGSDNSFNCRRILMPPV